MKWLILILIAGCGNEGVRKECEPIEQRVDCLEGVDHYSVCCDRQFIFCYIVVELDESLDHPRDRAGPDYLPCGTWRECQDELDEVDAYCRELDDTGTSL